MTETPFNERVLDEGAKHEARQRLIRQVQDGETTYEEAEAEAERRSLGVLQFRPTGDEVDPRLRPAWTLPMVLAWIAWRDFDEVREWNPDYRQRCREWKLASNGNGWVLARRDAGSGFDFDRSAYWLRLERRTGGIKLWSSDGDDEPRRARTKLWRALQEGAVVGDGIASGSGRRRDIIPAIEWQDLEDHFDSTTRREYFRRRHEPMEPAYFRVTFPSAPVIACWPERTSTDAGPPHTIGPETRAKLELTEAARRHVESGAPALPPSGIRTSSAEQAEEACRTWISGLSARPANKDGAFASARATFPNLSRKAFDRAWANAAPSAWREAGRRRKSAPA